MFPFGETVTVERPGAEDQYGDRDADAGTEHTIEGCAFYPRSSDELHEGRSTVITGLVMLAPPGADIRASDTIRREDGSRWPVEGSPLHWTCPLSGWHPGVQVHLRQVTG